MLVSSAVDRGLEHHLDQTKDYKIGIRCFSIKYTAFKKKRNRLVGLESGLCLCEVTCLSAKYCFSELAL